MRYLIKILSLVCLCLVLNSPSFAESPVRNIRFGIFEQQADGSYSIGSETTDIPKKLRQSGFRFGLSFENPSARDVIWFDMIRTPLERYEEGGKEKEKTTLKVSPKHQTHAARITDVLSFEENAPLGSYHLELYVDGKKIFEVDYTVKPDSSDGTLLARK